MTNDVLTPWLSTVALCSADLDGGEGGLLNSKNGVEGESCPLMPVFPAPNTSSDVSRQDLDLNEFAPLATKVLENGDAHALAEMAAVHEHLRAALPDSGPSSSSATAPPLKPISAHELTLFPPAEPRHARRLLIPCVDSPPRVTALQPPSDHDPSPSRVPPLIFQPPSSVDPSAPWPLLSQGTPGNASPPPCNHPPLPPSTLSSPTSDLPLLLDWSATPIIAKPFPAMLPAIVHAATPPKSFLDALFGSHHSSPSSTSHTNGAVTPTLASNSSSTLGLVPPTSSRPIDAPPPPPPMANPTPSEILQPLPSLPACINLRSTPGPRKDLDHDRLIP
ncbi:hypothetical protein Salat_0461300 [Sesamum alatum]|uniref:Uncharacterized protein n=1 Tax=Sesamum alatum TaxID=300844 RepID=A0AAE1Z3S4_9LAMI|nr:hypothetical protein Salat_0461300 [Sesamum alatum]